MEWNKEIKLSDLRRKKNDNDKPAAEVLKKVDKASKP